MNFQCDNSNNGNGDEKSTTGDDFEREEYNNNDIGDVNETKSGSGDEIKYPKEVEEKELKNDS